MSDLTLTFLGTGTSQGVPLIGCDCAVCLSADPRDTRSRSSVYVQTPETSWVIDTGTDFRAQCLREGVRKIDAVVYTHSHSDHIMGFDDLRPFCPREGTLPIYAGPEAMADIQRVFDFAFNGKNLFPGYMRPEPRVIEAPFWLGETLLTPMLVPHGRAKVFGYLLTRRGQPLVAYLSDCKTVPAEHIEKIRGVRHLIIDALRHKPHPTHMNVEESLAIIALVAPERAWFTHLCHDLGHEETLALLPAGVSIAYDGMKLHV